MEPATLSCSPRFRLCLPAEISNTIDHRVDPQLEMFETVSTLWICGLTVKVERVPL